MFAEVFASINSHPSQYYTYTLGISKTEITHTASYKESECIMPVILGNIAYHLHLASGKLGRCVVIIYDQELFTTFTTYKKC